MYNQRLDYKSLTQKELSEVRKKIDAKSYKRSIPIALFWFCFDLAFYLLTMYGIFVSHGVLGKVFFGFLAGVAASSMFVWAHDAAHGALFKSKLLSEVLGTIFMLPALNMYRLWCFGHNRIHHGFTSFSPLDWIWRPLTISEYKTLSKYQKILYRVERSFIGCGLHYIYKVWWPKMVMFKPKELDAKSKFIIQLDKIIVVMFAIIVSFIYFKYAGGLLSVIASLVIPFVVFNYIISLVVYLHHTNPDIPFFDERAEWNHTIGGLYCSTVIHSNWVVNILTHHILIHAPHHLDIRIPFYRLKTALISLKENYGSYVHEYKISIFNINHIFKSCKLYDYQNHVWYTFIEAKGLSY